MTGGDVVAEKWGSLGVTIEGPGTCRSRCRSKGMPEGGEVWGMRRARSMESVGWGNAAYAGWGNLKVGGHGVKCGDVKKPKRLRKLTG